MKIIESNVSKVLEFDNVCYFCLTLSPMVFKSLFDPGSAFQYSVDTGVVKIEVSQRRYGVREGVGKSGHCSGSGSAVGETGPDVVIDGSSRKTEVRGLFTLWHPVLTFLWVCDKSIFPFDSSRTYLQLPLNPTRLLIHLLLDSVKGLSSGFRCVF